jgi:hypothetical protein
MGQAAVTLHQSDLHYRIAHFIAKKVVENRFLVLLFMIGMTIFWLYHCSHVKIYFFTGSPSRASLH